MDAVREDLLRTLAADVKKAPPPPPPGNGGNGRGWSRLKIEEWLTARDIEFRAKKELDRHGRTVYVLKHCPFNPDHGDPDSCIMQDRDGKPSAQCFHNSCAGKGWREFKDAIGKPDAKHYDPPLKWDRASGQQQREAPRRGESDGGRGASGLHFSFDLFDSGTFFAKNYSLDWHVEKVLVALQPGVIGRASKVLKTTLVVDMVVSLGSGTPFLGTFRVNQCRVAILSGESGAAVIQETARRVCEAKGIDPFSLDAYWGFRLPRLSNAEDMTYLRAGLRERKIRVLFIDPLYLCLLSGQSDQRLQASNLFEVGPLLLAVAETCLAEGVTPVLIHHSKKFPEPGKPLELQDLAFAGIGEFARQWCLISRREPFEEGSGRHKLWLSVGGSVGHSGLWSIDADEGILDDRFGGRRWDVAVRAGREERSLASSMKEQKRKEKEARQLSDDCAKILTTVDKLADKEGWAVYTHVRDAGHLSTARMTRALVELKDKKLIQEGPMTVPTGRGLKGTKSASGLRRSRVGECPDSWDK